MEKKELALLGFEMWMVYLENCDREHLETFQVQNVNASLERIYSFYIKGLIPPEPTGPLAVSLMGSSWQKKISAIIQSCTNHEKVKDLLKLVDYENDGREYHNILYLYEVLRKADCLAFKSHNPQKNKDALYKYCGQQGPPDSQTYMSYFITCNDISYQFTFRDLQKKEALLKSYGCTYALISKCQQEIKHIHGVLIFAWPVTFKAVRSLLCGVELQNQDQEDRALDINVEPVFCYQEYPISYILNQEYDRLLDFRLDKGIIPHPVTVKDLDTQKVQAYCFKYTPKYYLAEKLVNFDEAFYTEHKCDDKYREYLSPLIISRSFYFSDKRKNIEILESIYGDEAIASIEEPLTLRADDPSITLQKPVLIAHIKQRTLVSTLNDHLNKIGALFKHVVIDFE